MSVHNRADRQFIALIAYFKETWLPYARDFCAFAVKTERNYGMVATSRTESKHGQLKRLLKRKRPDYEAMGIAVDRHILHEHQQYMHDLQMAFVRNEGYWVQRLQTQRLVKRITPYAMEEITTNCRLADAIIEGNRRAEREGTSPRLYAQECTHAYRLQKGLPCPHDCFKYICSQRRFDYRVHVAPQWWLVRPNVRDALICYVLDNANL